MVRAADRCSRRACTEGAHERASARRRSVDAAMRHRCRTTAGARSRSSSGSSRRGVLRVSRAICVLGSQILIVGAVRAVARPDPGLRGHRVARPCGVLRRRRVHGGPARRARLGRAASGLLARGRRGARSSAMRRSFLVVRGSDLTRLMVTLGIGLLLYEAANKAAFITGGVDGLSGVTMWQAPRRCSRSTSPARTAYLYSLAVLFLLFVLAAPAGRTRRSGCRLRGIRENAQAHAGDRRAGRAGAWSRSTRSARRSRASPARCSRRPRSSSGSTCSASRARPSC